MLWLPLQGTAAAVLSVCVQEKEVNNQIISMDSHHHDACHKQAIDSTTDYLIANLPCDDIACDAYSNTLILSNHDAPMLMNDTSAIAAFTSGFTSFIPELPHHPPLIASLH